MTYATQSLPFSEVGASGPPGRPASTSDALHRTPKQDQTIDPIETRESHHLSRSPEAPGQDTSGPAAAADTQPCSTGEARSDRDGKGGTPGAAPSHPIDAGVAPGGMSDASPRASSERDGGGSALGISRHEPVGADPANGADLPLDAPVRLTDPATSVAAARTLDAANDRALVLEALVAIGGRGSADDVWDHLDRTQPARRWQRSCVSSRLSQLKDPKRYAGDPPIVVVGEKVGPSGRQVLVFGAVA